MAKKENEEGKDMPKRAVSITPPNIGCLKIPIVGNAPFVQERFPQKATLMMKERQEAGSQGNKGKKREAKDFQQCFKDSMYATSRGDRGIPSSSFRCALVSACRLIGFHMTLAKLCVWIEADGFDAQDMTPLTFFTKGEPHYHESHVRLATGVADIRARAMWDPGWKSIVTVKYDKDQFSEQDIVNLMHRVGLQVGVGAGRPDSKKSCGMGWGTFTIEKSGMMAS